MTTDPPVILVHEMEQITAYRDLENLEVDNLMIRWDRIRRKSSAAHD
jgi:hypothetical protein